MEETNEEEKKMYARACTEVLEILKDAPPEDMAKIPKELMEALENKKDKDINLKQIRICLLKMKILVKQQEQC